MRTKIHPRAAKLYARIVLLYSLNKSKSNALQYTIKPSDVAKILEIPESRDPVGVAVESCASAGLKAFRSGTGSLTVSLEEHRTKGHKDCIREVYDYWVEAVGKSAGRCKLTTDRKSKVAARLREGYTIDELKMAIDGLAGSQYHRGDNEQGKVYLELEQCTRTGSRVEMFMGYAEKDQVNESPNVFDLMKRRNRS